MKIVHISLSGSFTEGWSYHENQLPFWHKQLGHSVVLIAKNTKHINEKIVKCDEECKTMDDGVKLYRINVHKMLVNTYARPNKKRLIDILKKEKPDLIWVHNVLNMAVFYAAYYKNKFDSNVIIVADNHVDFYNYKNDFLRRINLLYFSLKLKRIDKFIKIYYGVTPGRVDFLSKYLHISPNKTRLTIQGGDPNIIDFENKESIRRFIREKMHIKEEDFLYITGGKFNKSRSIIPLVSRFSSSVKQTNKLLVFGSICEEDLDAFNCYLSKDKRIIYTGFLNQKQICSLFLASDLGIFFGLHSVLWEEALACGIPCIFKKLVGFEHVECRSSMMINNLDDFDFDSFSTGKTISEMKINSGATREKFLYNIIAKKTILDICEEKEK